jgi:ribosomal protein S18 acetylase RimI-like enzyme
MVTIDVLGPDDWRVWREVRLAALAEAPHVFGSTLAGWTGDGDREDRWRGRLTSVPYNAVAREVATGAAVGQIGAVAAAADPDGRVELISLWVAPAARGEGVGDALVAAVCAWAADAAVVLRVYDDNAPAARLYARHGFVAIGDERGDDDRRELVLVRPGR